MSVGLWASRFRVVRMNWFSLISVGALAQGIEFRIHGFSGRW